MSTEDELREELEYWKSRALTDKLTGLRNREALEEDLSEASRYEFVMIDVDDFKEINDNQGHEAGDKILQQVAEKLEIICSEDSTPYRYGGEEFLIVVDGQDRVAARAVDIIDSETEVTISAGVGDTVSEADRKMYRAKDSGKNGFVS